MTYEEAILAIKENVHNEISNDWGMGIGVLEEEYAIAIKCIEKQIPKKHIIELNSVLNKELICPSCGISHGIYGDVYIPTTSEYCPFCGQKIDGSDEE